MTNSRPRDRPEICVICCCARSTPEDRLRGFGDPWMTRICSGKTPWGIRKDDGQTQGPTATITCELRASSPRSVSVIVYERLNRARCPLTRPGPRRAPAAAAGALSFRVRATPRGQNRDARGTANRGTAGDDVAHEKERDEDAISETLRTRGKPIWRALSGPSGASCPIRVDVLDHHYPRRPRIRSKSSGQSASVFGCTRQ